MNRTRMRLLAPVAALAVAAPGLVAGCDGSDGGSSGTVSITVAGMPNNQQPEMLNNFNRNITDFTAANPGIKVTGDEAVFDVRTFQALLAGGKLPTVFYVPFTEMQGLIARKQVADITAAIPKDSTAARINPAIQKIVKDSGDHTYGVPVQAYSMGLLYNRDLFKKAGLDPDKPPTTWDEVRAAAKTIQSVTGVQGFASMTKDNTGGWALTAMSYAHGSTIESADGKHASVDNDATRSVLEFYRALRWEDNTFGSNFLIGYKDALDAFAGGRIGMFVQGADAYKTVVSNLGMSSDAFGLAPLPQTARGLGTLGGGTVAIINPRASADQVKAAIKWVEHFWLRKYSGQEAAVADAKAKAADKQPVGEPTLSLFDQATTDTYLEWVKDYVNVPRKNYAAYFASAQTMALVPEPPAKTQETYGTLDTVVQAVLTRKDADINALLNDAQRKVQATIDAG
ncbi:ABC transporter substrate-binding protein [Dactylosporangium sp. CA-233914]|uniref:ABC transporter substrate-binding protein n=1 Tax=Dactylosporangium sp. CA-233914 TaxID=3239934 RepID=UPI003D8CDA14